MPLKWRVIEPDSDDPHAIREGTEIVTEYGKIKLTAREARVFVYEVDPEEEEPEWASRTLVGKVLAPNSVDLEIATISAATKPAWGNPRGMHMRPFGEHLFVVEFGSEMDKRRVLEGSPWSVEKRGVGKLVVVLQKCDLYLRPSKFRFDEIAVWIQILNLPPVLRNEKSGMEIAGLVGEVEKIHVDEKGRALGKELRARVRISVREPLTRAVFVQQELHEVVYEKLPFFCCSCGIIGHSEDECATPARRDENGLLPFSEKKLRHIYSSVSYLKAMEVKGLGTAPHCHC